MENIEKHFIQSIQLRCDEVLNRIAATNPQYEQLARQIIELGKELGNLLTEGGKELFRYYAGTVLQRIVLITQLLYEQGFTDGSKLKALFKQRGVAEGNPQQAQQQICFFRKDYLWRVRFVVQKVRLGSGGEVQKVCVDLQELNVKANLDADIYDEEYAKISGEMEELRQQCSAFTQAEFKRKDTLSRVREIEKMLRERDVVEEFDEELFVALVEYIRVKSLVEVVFVLKAGVEVREIL